MVQDTGKAIRADSYRPVNLPEPVQVEEVPSSGLPLAVRAPQRQAVITIEDTWRIDDEWWRPEPISRLYCEVTLDTGQILVLYKDLINDCWYRQSY
jgi:hypothetical protein